MDLEEAAIDRYQAALSLLSDLDDNALDDAPRRISEILRVVLSPIWRERIANLEEGLIAQLLRADKDLLRGCMTLLHAGVEDLMEVKKDLSSSANAKIDELKEALAKEVASNEALMKENFVLRTRLHVQQQDLFQHDTESRDVVQHLRALGKDRAELALEKAKLAEECSVKSSILERQATAIAQLMDQSEKDVKERDKVLEALKNIREEKEIFEINLQKHSKVIENLIHVNADLMETANQYKMTI